MANLGSIDPRTLPQLFAWYDANFINGFTAAQPADGAAIAQWNDLSPNARHLVQGTGANQPLFRATGSASGQLPSVNFVDSTDTMAVAIAGVVTRPVTIIAVVKNTLADDAAYHMAVTFNAQRIGVGLDWTGANNTFIPRDDAAIMAGAGVAGDITSWHVLSFVAQPVGALSRASADGAHATVAGLAGTNTNSNVDVGISGANGFIGHVAEIIILTGEVSQSMLFAIEVALAQKWNVLPSYKYGA